MVDRFTIVLANMGRLGLKGFLGLGILLIFSYEPVSAWSAELVTNLPARSTPSTPIIDKVTVIRQLHKSTGLPITYLRSAINIAQFEPSVISRMDSPYEAKPYVDYRPLFVRKGLARLGRNYLEKHHEIFQDEWKRFAVEPEIIAAILAIETHFGALQGKDRVLDSLYTLATGFPRRSKFFLKQLGDYLQICHTENLDPESITGSYAGAFGAPQFMPSSYLSYAIDGNGDGHRDVWKSPKDIIFSIANYFQKNGWRARMPVAYWLSREPTSEALLSQRKKEMHDWEPVKKLYSEGMEKLPAPWSNIKVSLITMQPKTKDQTAVVSHNFYVITRWNRSYNYAMATTELANLMGCKLCGTGP